MVAVFLIFWVISILFATVATPNLHSYQNAQAFPILDIFANMLYLVFFVDSHSNRYRFCSSHIKNVEKQVQLI